MVNICVKVNFWKLDIYAISEFRMKKRVPKSECTRKIEWDRSVLKILTFWSRSRVHLVKAFFFSFFLNFFFLQAVRTGSGCGSVRVKPGQTLVGGDVMDDVTALDAYGTCAHVARVARALAPTVWRVCTREI